MTIQYVGFSVAATSRIYGFRVIDAPEKIREFTVTVQLKAFGSTLLKFQDAPGLCSARLKRELEGETQESRAEPRLRIEEQDIREYIGRYYPRKGS